MSWDSIFFDDFNGIDGTGAWGRHFSSGGIDATLNTAAADGMVGGTGGSIRLVDNSGAASSAFTPDLVPTYPSIATYQELRVKFWFYVRSFEGSEAFEVEYSTNGSDWTIAKRFVRNVDFVSSQSTGTKTYTTVDLSSSAPYSSLYLRFKADASGNSDYLYIDDVQLQGRSAISGTDTPTPSPSSVPSQARSPNSTMDPSTEPSEKPSHGPSAAVSEEPSSSPSFSPTLKSEKPSVSPSGEPTWQSAAPSLTPSAGPTWKSEEPSAFPSDGPTWKSDSPSVVLSQAPSLTTSQEPSVAPTTERRTTRPSVAPSASVSETPSISSHSLSSNLVSNPGFELGLADWFANGGHSIATESVIGHTGSITNAALISGRTAAWQGIAQDMLGDMTPGVYTVSGYAKLRNGISESFGLTLYKREDGQNNYQGVWGTMSNTEWTKIEGTLTVTMNGVVEVLRIYAEGPGAGVEFWLDDVKVVPYASDPPTTELPTSSPVRTYLHDELSYLLRLSLCTEQLYQVRMSFSPCSPHLSTSFPHFPSFVAAHRCIHFNIYHRRTTQLFLPPPLRPLHFRLLAHL